MVTSKKHIQAFTLVETVTALIVSGIIGGVGYYIDTFSSEQMDWFARLLELIGVMLFLYACIAFGKKDRESILD